MTLTVLKHIGQVLFSTVFELGKTTGVKHHSHHIILRVHAIHGPGYPHYITVNGNLGIWLRIRVLHYKIIPLFPPLILYSLAGSHYVQSTCKEWVSCLTSLEAKYINYVTFFFMGDLYVLPFIYLLLICLCIELFNWTHGFFFLYSGL